MAHPFDVRQGAAYVTVAPALATHFSAQCVVGGHNNCTAARTTTVSGTHNLVTHGQEATVQKRVFSGFT